MSPRVLPVPARLLVVAAVLAVGYRYSLGTLVSEWNHDTPLADLALVPLLALALAGAAAARHRYVGELRLGRFDYVVAIPLLLLAILLVAFGPIAWSKYFWATRVDLLTLPLVAIAAVVLLFGVRIVFPFALPIVFLLLAWPLPYTVLLEHAIAFFTTATTAAVTLIATGAHLATADAQAGAGVFVLRHAGNSFSVGIGDACSGVNSLVGFLVTGTAGLYFIRGRLTRKLAWFASAATLVYGFNVARILAILVVGRALGERAAFEVVHPVAGLLALIAAVALAVRLLPAFGLALRQIGERAAGDTPIARPAPLAERATLKRTVPRLAVVGVATIALAFAGSNLAVAARGFDNFGRPAIKSFAAQPSVGRAWRVSKVETIGWAAPYYGKHSSWVRYRLRPRTADASQAFTIWLDAITSGDLGALNAYTLAHCYSFHGFRVQLSRRVDLGNGVIGQEFTYDTSRATWHAVAWQWPVLGRTHVEHERIVLIASSSRRPTSVRVAASAPLAGPVLALQNARAPHRDDNADLTRALVAAASAAVAARVAA